MSQLDSSAIKSRIKPWVDNFLSASHNISEEEFSIYEANDPFIQGFIMNIEQLLNEFKVSGSRMNKNIYNGIKNFSAITHYYHVNKL